MEITKAIKVFVSYSHKDESYWDQLKNHLATMKRRGFIADWYDREITAGSEWADEIKKNLGSAQIILLLVSPDFLSSNYQPFKGDHKLLILN